MALISMCSTPNLYQYFSSNDVAQMVLTLRNGITDINGLELYAF